VSSCARLTQQYGLLSTTTVGQRQLNLTMDQLVALSTLGARHTQCGAGQSHKSIGGGGIAMGPRTRDNHGNVRPLPPRRIASLSEAEEENGQSRIYLGIHWSFEKTEGIVQ
jgi:hypothetical protein